jgi:hypothetical protein
MRRYLTAVAAVGLVLTAAGRAGAQDEPRAIIEKAVKAYGGADKLARLKAGYYTGKGTLQLMGMAFACIETTHLDQPNHFRTELKLNAGGVAITTVTAFDGKTAWTQVNGNNYEVPAGVADELKMALYIARAEMLTPLIEDKAFALSPLGEAQVDGKPAIGVKIAHAKHKDLELFFDKATGLLAKIAYVALDETGQAVKVERFHSDYQIFDGLMRPTQIKALRGGKEYVMVKITEYKILDKVDPNLFMKP